MIEHGAEFFSNGVAVKGLFRTPDTPPPWPAIVQGPGWLGLKDAALYQPYHQAFTAAGFAVLIFDYRGFGDSDGDRGALSPGAQLEDLISAVTFLKNHADIDGDHIGVFGSGGTGGGNAVLLAANDPRVSGVVSQVPVADGTDWLRRMRTTSEDWQAFLTRIEDDRADRVNGGTGARVNPREEIMIPSAERRATSVKQDVDGRIPTSVPLAAAEEIMQYRPIDCVARVTKLMVVAVAGDVVTPTDHAVALYENAQDPRLLVMQHNTTHYAAYEQYGDVVIPKMVDWFRANTLGTGDAATGWEAVG